MRFDSKFQFLLQKCFMMKLDDYVSSMNCDIDSLMNQSCF